MQKGFRKFGNVPTVVDGRKFSSKAEAKRYSELKLLERAGQIKHLQCQPKFPLIIDGKLVGRYTADFQYEERGREVIEEVKSAMTRLLTDYRLRLKVFKALYPNVDHRELA